MSDDSSCATCAEKTGTKRYCAPGRCYCAHPACPAYPSWVDLAAIPAPDTTPTPAAPTRRSSWDDREDSTWIDQL